MTQISKTQIERKSTLGSDEDEILKADVEIVEGYFRRRRAVNSKHGALVGTYLEALEMRIQIREVRAICCQKRKTFLQNMFVGWERWFKSLN